MMIAVYYDTHTSYITDMTDQALIFQIISAIHQASRIMIYKAYRENLNSINILHFGVTMWTNVNIHCVENLNFYCKLIIKK